MKIIDIKFAQLHDTLFLAGTNHGQKLDIARRDIKLTFDEEQKRLIVEFKQEVALVPETNISNMIPADSKPFIINIAALSEEKPLRPTATLEMEAETHKRRGRPPMARAQVSDPTRDAVFGQGK